MRPPGNEKIVWLSKGGGVAGHGQLVVIGLVLLGLFSCSGVTTPLFLLMGVGDERGVMETLVTIAMSMFWPAVLAAIVVPLWLVPRLRPTFFLTPTTLHARRALGGWQSVPLAGLHAAERKVVTYHTRYGPREVITHRAALLFASGQRTDLGPIADVDGLIELLNDAVISRHVSLEALPGVIGGEPAPAETRKDVFLAASSESEGMRYGPLFFGPTRILRFTEVLEPSALARLYTVIGDAMDGDEAELQAVAFAKRPLSGYVLDLERAQTKAKVDRDVLYLSMPQREEAVKLAMSDADRLRAFLKSSR